VNVTILGSGSKGNALVIECEEDRILVDAGFAARTLVKRLRAARIAPESISALVLTHEHGDHVAGARVAARRYGWTVYATAGTLAQMPELADANPVAISPRESLQLDTMRVSTVRIPHDAVEPVAVCVESRSTGARCAVAYDIGHVTGTLQQALGDLDAVILESNHDVDLLRTGPYPRALQRRISGGKGHLSNTEAARLAADIVHRGLGKVILAHLSDQNNTPEVARRTVARELRRAGYSGALDVAPQETVTRFSVSRSRRVQQIDLF
jgi:phosphoribosyl 1,2-cyclic phosphodiesterase